MGITSNHGCSPVSLKRGDVKRGEVLCRWDVILKQQATTGKYLKNIKWKYHLKISANKFNAKAVG